MKDKTVTRKYSYKMIGVYPKNGEEQIWQQYVKKSSHNTLSAFIREAVNLYCKYLDGEFDLTTAGKHEDVNLKAEVERLRKELTKLYNENKQLKQALTQRKKTDYWNRIWNAISTTQYKTTDQILRDAGIITPLMDYYDELAEEHHLQQVLIDYMEECRAEGKPFPLKYEEGKGWVKLNL